MLVPNDRGLDRALELGCRHIAIFGSATETFAQKNLNRSLDEQFAMFEPTVRRARDAGLDVRAYVSMCFGDPWEGAVPVDQVVEVGKRLFDLGASQLSLGDTIGVGTAGHVTALVRAFVEAGMGTDQLAMHFHDTYGQALANTYAALQAGITTYDASAGGLGGCPYAKSATGNLATEDLVWMLRGLGIETGVDLEEVAADQRLDGRPPRPSQPLGRGPCPRPGRDSGVRQNRAHEPVVYLHVGAPKTGTTYLQDRLGLNTRSLAAPRGPRADRVAAGQPRAVPVPGGPRPARPGLGRRAGPRLGQPGTRWSARCAGARAPSSSATRSSRPPRPTGSPRRWRTSRTARCTSSTPRVTWPARSPAAWQESIKQGRKWSYRRFLDRCRARPVVVLPRLRRADVLGTWGAGLPRSASTC